LGIRRAIRVEYIGKESNRWEEQYFLGPDEGADIPYGPNPNAPITHVAELKSLVEEFGERQVALQIKTSRNTLRRMISGENRAPSQRLLRQIAAAALALKTEASDRRAGSALLRGFAETEARKIGHSELLRSFRDGAANGPYRPESGPSAVGRGRPSIT
jgi:hypothetical protein